MQRETPSPKLPFGSPIPQFSLKNVDGTTVDQSYFSGAKASLVVFTCNHCPYVKGSEKMLSAIVKTFEARGLRTVTINSNDAVQYPDDSFENMQAKHRDLGLPYPYLYDESQSVAKSFDAACTPECYLFDSAGKLVYHGTINDSPKDAGKVSRDFLSPAIEQTLSGSTPTPNYVHPIGCSIKWRQ